jgi:hypothetical protein
MKKIVKKTPIIKKGVVKNSGAVKVANPPKKNSWLTTLAIVNVIAFLGVIVVNYLAVSLPIG